MRQLRYLAVGFSLAIWFVAANAFSIRPAHHKYFQGRIPLGVCLKAASSSEGSSSSHVVFEYCTGCRWITRAFWMAQELLTTFNDDNLGAVTLMPSRPPPSARFVVKHYTDDASSSILWDQSVQEGFPEIKDLKQLVRDKISPDLYLGHSDNEERRQGTPSTSAETEEESTAISSSQILSSVLENVKEPNVAIQYCTGCRWMLRSAYFGTELMTTLSEELNSVTLIPSRPPEKGGIFVSKGYACNRI